MHIVRRSRAIFALLIGLVLVACSTVPYSERNRVILLSEGDEKEMGIQAYTEILSQSRPSSDFGSADMVRRVGMRIAAVADKDLEKDEREPFQWEFNLIDDPQTVNAFCLPGGKVAFFSGILPICRDELGVAVVMGHEVAHALARHGGERVSQQYALNAIASVVAALASKDAETQETVAGLLGVGLGVAVALPFSRKHESEADYIGLMLMAQAGYDPREAPRFWERMREASGGKAPPEFLSTHPSDEKRIQELDDAMGEALDYYEKATGQKVAPSFERIEGKVR